MPDPDPFDDRPATVETLIGEPARSGVDASASAALPSTGVGRSRIGGRYEILGLLGSGGMGAVYKARDVELDEIVALKMLRPELLDSAAVLERFRREVKLARRVTHANVARTYDIGEHEGEKFLTMEFVDGEPLSALLARQRRLPFEQMLEIISGVCAGLSAAHAAGIVHRDLKPENVMLARNGRVVITDFGVARCHTESIDGNKTLGGVVGTPAYMAPEQVEGAPDVDARADLYAVGVMVFEMLTGESPWSGQSAFSLAAARLSGAPPDPRTRQADIPRALAELTLRSMARERAERFSSAEEFAQALGSAAPTVALSSIVPIPSTPPASSLNDPSRSTVAGEKTVAVLPFSNPGAEADGYLADGLTEDLIDTLSVTRGLKVRPRSVVMGFRDKNADPRAIGSELGVQVVVEGSVRRSGDALRIAARVISVADGFQLWAKRFDRPTADFLVVSDEVAHAIAEALSVDLAAPAREAPSDPMAIDLYLRARQEFHRIWPDAVRRSVELFREAEARAPGHPTILSGYARAVVRLWWHVPDPTSDLAKLARETAERAVKAAPDHGEPRLAQASVCFAEGDVVSAARHVRSALARAPMLADAHMLVADLLSEVGRPEAALARYQTALSLDPGLRLEFNMARMHALLGEWSAADALLEKAEGDPELRVTLAISSTRMALWSPDPIKALERVPEFDKLPPIDAVRYAKAVVELIRHGELPPGHRELLQAGIAPRGRAPRLIGFLAPARHGAFRVRARRRRSPRLSRACRRRRAVRRQLARALPRARPDPQRHALSNGSLDRGGARRTCARRARRGALNSSR